MEEHGRFKLENVVMTWPYLYQKQIYEGRETKYKATFLIPKEHAIIETISAHCQAKIAEKGVKVRKDSWCISDGDDYEVEYNHNHYILTAGSRKMPLIITPAGEISRSDEGEFYAGVIVDALVSFWVNTKGQNRVVGELHLVRKVADGEPLAGVSDRTLLEEALGEEAAAAALSGQLDYSNSKGELTDDDVPF